MPHTRSLFLIAAVAAALLTGCGEREPEPRPAEPLPPAVVPSPPVAQLTGWPAGLGRALVLRLTSPGETYRLVVPELGDARFADSSISVKVGDSLPVILLGHRGRVGQAVLAVLDAEAGTGACVTWPSVELAAEYEARNLEKQEKEDAAMVAAARRKGMTLEKRQYKEQREEAKE
ncbi:MAG: hypothetical protein WDZ58_06905, partial [Gemmatimonadaceae bacterium]